MQAEMVRPESRSIPTRWIKLSGVAVLAAALPTIVTLLIFWYLYPSVPLWNVLPAFPNDEVAYWHEILTFKDVGFGGGYYTYEEFPAPWSVSHFSVHGPVFPILYGLVARVVGWGPSSGSFFNLVLLALSLLAAFRIGRFGPGAMLALSLLVSTSWWVLIMLPSVMQETLHQAIAIVLGALLGRLALGSRVHTGRMLAAALVLMAIEGLMRPTFVLLFGPALLLALRPRHWLASGLLLASTVPVFGATWFLWRYISAPVTTGVAVQVAGLTGASNPLEWPLHNLAVSFQMLRDAPGIFSPADGRFLTLVHWQVIACCLVVGSTGLRRLLKRPAGWIDGMYADLLHLWNLGGLLLVVLIFDETSSGFPTARALMPHLLLSLVVMLVTRSHRLLMAALLLANVLLIGPGLDFYRVFRADAVIVDHAKLDQFRQEIASQIVYDPTKSPWCNTLDVAYNDYATQIIAVPGGIGVTYLPLENELNQQLKARYLVLDPPDAVRLGQHTRLQQVVGRLYENLDSGCGAR